MLEKFEADEKLEKDPIKLKLIISVAFLIILSVLIYSSFSGDFPFIGNIVLGDLDPNQSILISADLTVPVLFLDGKYESIKISGG